MCPPHSSCLIQQAFLPPATFQLSEFVYCANTTVPSRVAMSVRPQGRVISLDPMFADDRVEAESSRPLHDRVWDHGDFVREYVKYLFMATTSTSNRSLDCLSPHHSGKTKYWRNTSSNISRHCPSLYANDCFYYVAIRACCVSLLFSSK
jgi:hypothetical protein